MKLVLFTSTLCICTILYSTMLYLNHLFVSISMIQFNDLAELTIVVSWFQNPFGCSSFADLLSAPYTDPSDAGSLPEELDPFPELQLGNPQGDPCIDEATTSPQNVHHHLQQAHVPLPEDIQADSLRFAHIYLSKIIIRRAGCPNVIIQHLCSFTTIYYIYLLIHILKRYENKTNKFTAVFFFAQI